MRPSVVGQLIALLRDELHIDVASPDTDLLESGLLDSLHLVLLLLQIEQRMGVRIALGDVELDDLRSVHRIARVIAARAAADQAGGCQARRETTAF